MRLPSIRFNRLALKITGLAVPVTLLVVILVLIFARVPIPWGVLALLAVVNSGLVYAGAHHYLHRRMHLAYRTLQEIRNRQFDNLEATRVPEGDELSNLNRQVYRTGQALQREIEELKKVENYRREFLGNVSHELKTPIFAIQGFTETLLDGALDDVVVNRQFLHKILRNAQRLNNLANDLADISRIETGELKMTMASFDLVVLVREVVDALEARAEQHQIRLYARISESLPFVYADRDRISQVLTNLIENAMKYNNPGGYVEVGALRLPSGVIKVSVVDDGLGIEAGHISRLTERFYRVDRSRSRAKGGTGLGLAIVKHILEAHGQRLMIESIPGLGSTFSFLLAPQPERPRELN